MKTISALETISQVGLESSLPEDISEYLLVIREIVNIKIINSIYGNNPISEKEYTIKNSHNISRDCVFDIIETIEYQYLFDKVQSIFLEQIEKDEEIEIFENFLYDFYEFSVEELVSRDYISSLDKDSITLKLIQMVYNGDEIIFSMIKILKELGINVKSSDLIDNDLGTNLELHIRDIQKKLTKLVIGNDKEYFEEKPENRVLH